MSLSCLIRGDHFQKGWMHISCTQSQSVRKGNGFPTFTLMQSVDQDCWIEIERFTISEIKLDLKYDLRLWVDRSQSNSSDLLTTWMRETADCRESGSVRKILLLLASISHVVWNHMFYCSDCMGFHIIPAYAI